MGRRRKLYRNLNLNRSVSRKRRSPPCICGFMCDPNWSQFRVNTTHFHPICRSLPRGKSRWTSQLVDPISHDHRPTSMHMSRHFTNTLGRNKNQFLNNKSGFRSQLGLPSHRGNNIAVVASNQLLTIKELNSFSVIEPPLVVAKTLRASTISADLRNVAPMKVIVCLHDVRNSRYVVAHMLITVFAKTTSMTFPPRRDWPPRKIIIN